ncbi:DUF7594 domain-containing protein [Rathayibacter caricis]|nr:DNRLRE domain-containing protein [Rathayibacter caricis]
MRGSPSTIRLIGVSRRLSFARLWTSRPSIVAVLVSVALLLGGLVAPAAQADPSVVSVSSVSSAHPRLIASASDFATTFGLINSDNTARAWSTAVQKEADGYLSTSPVTYRISAGSMLETSRTVLNRAYALGFMYRKSGKVVYAQRLASELRAVAAFPNWNPDNFLDTAEMAHAVAVGYDWIYPALSSEQRTSVRTALVDKALTPALSAYASTAAKYAWTTQASNWNIVSGSGIGMAALVVADTDPAIAQRALDAVTSSLQYGLPSYGADGGFAEGLTYWAYSTSYLSSYIASLEVATGDDHGLLATPGLQASAQWANALTGPSGRQFNFGDAWVNEALTVPLMGLEYLYEDFGFRSRSIVGRDGFDADTVSARPLLWYRPAPAATASAPPLDAGFSSAGVTTLRSGWGQADALWAGLRATSGPITGHSDLDNGSFVLDAQGVNWFGDLGADSYSLPGYFTVASEERWNYYRKRAEGSNTMVFGRGPGPDASTNPSASQSLVASTGERGATVADLSSASNGVASWKRGIALIDGRSRVLLQDEVSGVSGDAWWFAHTRADISVAEDGRSAVLSLEGEQLLARIVSSGSATFTYQAAAPLPTSPAPEGQTANAGVSKLAIKLSGASSYTIAVEFSPLRPAQGSASPLAVTPLAGWGASASESGAPALKYLAMTGKPLASFSPQTRTYDVTASVKSSPPVIEAYAQAGASATVTQATSVPGVATIRVKRSGSADALYRVYINRGPIQISTATASDNGALAGRTIDGLPYTRWSTATDAYLQYDLGFSQIVNHLEIVWLYLPAKGQFFEVQLSTDKTNWTTVYTGQAKAIEQRHWASFQTGPRAGRYVRVVTHGDKAADKTAVIDEVEVFGDNDPRTSASAKTPHYAVAVSIEPKNIEIGSTAAVSATVTAPVGGSSSPPVQYVSSDPSIATITDDGIVAGVAGGTVRVGALVEAGRDYVYNLQTITVTDSRRTAVVAQADTWVQGGTTTNYNRTAALTVRHHALYPQFDRLAYLKFDLGGIDPRMIETATLTFSAAVVDTSGTDIDVEAWETSGAWDAATVTYATRPTLSYRVGSTHVNSTKSVRRMDITDYARLKAGGEASIGLTQPDRPSGLGLVVQVDSLESIASKPTIELTLQDPSTSLPRTPTIASASADYAGAGSATGTVSAEPGESVVVDVFVQDSDTCGATRAAGTLVGSTTVTAASDGSADFTVAGAFSISQHVVAATTIAGRGSAVSPCAVVRPTSDATTTTTLTPSADTWVTGSAPTVTYGRDSVLQVRHLTQYPGNDRVAYLGFDLSKIPAGDIISATLRFSAVVDDTRGAAMDLRIRKVSDSWTAASTNWNNRPVMGDQLGVVGVDATKSTREIDVTSYVSESPRSMTSIGIDEPDIASGVGLVVKIDSMESAQKPSLEVVLRPAG